MKKKLDDINHRITAKAMELYGIYRDRQIEILNHRSGFPRGILIDGASSLPPPPWEFLHRKKSATALAETSAWREVAMRVLDAGGFEPREAEEPEEPPEVEEERSPLVGLAAAVEKSPLVGFAVPLGDDRPSYVLPTKLDPYEIELGGVKVDPYRVARAFGIDDPVIFQALKKLLRMGRKHKGAEVDVREAITTLERWEAMNREDQKEKKS